MDKENEIKTEEELEFEAGFHQALTSAADMLRQEGYDKGFWEGIRFARKEVLLVVLEKRFGQMELGHRGLLECGNIDDLAGWLRRMLTAQSLDEVFYGGS